MQAKIKKKKSLYERLQKNEKFQKVSSVVLPVILGIVIVVLWQTQVLHMLLRTDTFTLPLLDRIGTILSENIGNVWKNVITVEENWWINIEQ